jgi:hypothetical protein
MWAHYRKTLIPIQIMIFGICGWMYYFGHFPPIVVGVFFVVMQVAAMLGALWAARLKAKIEAARGKLPLEKR